MTPRVLARAQGTAGDPMFVGTPTDTGCYKGSQAGDPKSV